MRGGGGGMVAMGAPHRLQRSSFLLTNDLVGLSLAQYRQIMIISTPKHPANLANPVVERRTLVLKTYLLFTM